MVRVYCSDVEMKYVRNISITLSCSLFCFRTLRPKVLNQGSTFQAGGRSVFAQGFYGASTT